MGRWILHTCFYIYLVFGSIAQGWGDKGHQRINQAAAQIIDGSFGQYIKYYADSLASHAPDPDAWKRNDPEEGQRHYIDIDLYSAYPFTDLPPTQAELISSFGVENVRRWGIGPYWIEEYSRNIIEMMKAGDWAGVIIPLAALGHYVADLHMPLHVVANYNGQLSGNDGIHFRWEVPMVDTYIDTVIPVGAVYQIDDLLVEGFKIVRESYTSHHEILHADSLARNGQTPEVRELLRGYDTLPETSDYLAILYRESGQLAQNRMNQAALRVASFWYSCWIQAGQPSPEY